MYCIHGFLFKILMVLVFFLEKNCINFGHLVFSQDIQVRFASVYQASKLLVFMQYIYNKNISKGLTVSLRSEYYRHTAV